MFVHISKVQNKVKCPASASAGPGAGIGCNVMVRTKIQNTELQNTKDTNVPFNWPGSSAGPGSRHSAQGGEDKGGVGGGLLATPGTLPNVHCYSLLPHVLYIYNIANYCLMCSAWTEPPQHNPSHTV